MLTKLNMYAAGLMTASLVTSLAAGNLIYIGISLVLLAVNLWMGLSKDA